MTDEERRWYLDLLERQTVAVEAIAEGLSGIAKALFVLADKQEDQNAWKH